MLLADKLDLTNKLKLSMLQVRAAFPHAELAQPAAMRPDLPRPGRAAAPARRWRSAS